MAPGSYGSNGNDDAAADAVLLSRAVGRPVRVQWMRQDEHGWDPKGPPQLLELRAGSTREGRHRRLGNADVAAHDPARHAGRCWAPMPPELAQATGRAPA